MEPQPASEAMIGMQVVATESTDFDRILQANLARVFGERDSGRRMAAIHDLYAEDAVLYEPDSVASGHAAINRAVEALLSKLPPAFTFTSAGPAMGHHGLGRIQWRAGPPDGPVAVTGTDVARIEDSKIRSLHVFLDPPTT